MSRSKAEVQMKSREKTEKFGGIAAGRCAAMVWTGGHGVCWVKKVMREVR